MPFLNSGLGGFERNSDGQDDPTLKLAPQVLVCVYSPVVGMADITNGPPPEL
jgi:hypothetical protein